MNTPAACCHDNFEWYSDDIFCPSCHIAHHTWKCLAEARTDALIDHLTGAPMTLPIQLVDGGTAPTRAHTHDAGLDCYAAADRWIFDDAVTGIPLGVSVAIPTGHVGLLTLRSSLGAEGLVVPNAPRIDAGFRGELRILLTCVGGTESYHVKAGDRVAQLVILPCVTPAVEVVDTLPPSTDGRGAGRRR